MKSLLKGVLTAVLALVGGFPCENPVYSQSKEPTVVEAADVDNPDLKLTLEIYPTEIYLGDVVFFAARIENVSDKTIEHCLDYGNLPDYINYLGVVRITAPQLEQEYLWRPENTTGSTACYAVQSKDLPPGEKRLAGKAAVEFPPLEDWNDPFWKELREKLTPDGIVCQLQVAQQYGIGMNRQTAVFKQDILVKPRPEGETALLEKWFDDTPEEVFPRRGKFEKASDVSTYGKDDVVYSWGREDIGNYLIVVDGKEYHPRYFVRSPAFRKPFIPNNPTTLDGWRELESKFCDSSLRDDITFTRLLLDYLAANADKTEEAKKELIDWLAALPEVQRSFFLTALLNQGYYFKQTPLADKSRAFLHALYNSLDDKWKTSIYVFDKGQYKETPLTPPKGYEPPRPFSRSERIRPTEEEIANGSRELKDGCRMWFYQGSDAEEIIAAKLIRLNDKTNKVLLKDRYGSELNLDFAKFGKEDQDFILEYHNLGF